LQGIESLSKSRKRDAAFDPNDLESNDAADYEELQPGESASRRRSDRRERNRAHGEHGQIDFADLEDDISPMKKFDRKTLQLCGQVARALAGCFADCPDPVINQLTVFGVTPKAGTAALEVAVYPAIPGVELDPHDVLPRLRENQGHLQDEVSHAITRKYAPRLTFRMATPDEVAAIQQPAASVDPDLLKLAIPTEEEPE
jgi:ribosome-binding factor A